MSLKKLLEHTYVKLLVIALTLVLSVVLGVRIGQSLPGSVSHQPVPVDAMRQGVSGPPQMNLHTGDLFPPESVLTANQEWIMFDRLYEGKPALVLFVSLKCGPCVELLQSWDQVLSDRVADGVQQIVALSLRAPLPAEYKGLFEKVQLVRYDGDIWRSLYNQDFWPTLVGIDNNGFISHIQYGYEQTIDFELVERFFKQTSQ